MNNLSNITTIREILGRHGFHFSEALGQNFLTSPMVCLHMAEQLGAAPETGVLEVDPSIGVLTHGLAERVQKVVSIGLDHRLLPVLEKTLIDCGNVMIINGDILKLDLKKLLQCGFTGMPVSVCANLPYYITSPVTMWLSEERFDIIPLTVMMQRETMRRICVQPDTQEYETVMVMVHYYAGPETLFEVPRGSFLPTPNVDSSIIRLTLRKKLAVRVENEAGFFSLVHMALGRGRETMLNPVSAGLSLPKEMVSEVLDDIGFDRRARAEQLAM